MTFSVNSTLNSYPSTSISSEMSRVNGLTTQAQAYLQQANQRQSLLSLNPSATIASQVYTSSSVPSVANFFGTPPTALGFSFLSSLNTTEGFSSNSGGSFGGNNRGGQGSQQQGFTG
jgi:hypothetical protein